MGIEKNRFGPRQVYTHLNIDYPTLSLTEPDDNVRQYTIKANPPKLTMNLDDDSNPNISETLDLIDKFSE
jgi:hypothetical protein